MLRASVASWQADNVAAIHMYQRSGFQIAERLVDHYNYDNAHHDALRLVKTLRNTSRLPEVCVVL